MNNDPEKKKANGRYEGTNYRYSTRTIRIFTRACIAYMIIALVVGIGLGLLGSTFFGDATPTWYKDTAVAIAVSGVGIPLLASAWFGMTTINRYAGPVGVLLVFGMVATAIGDQYYATQSLWLWIGIAALALAVVLIFLIGFREKVPMWLQLPSFGSPRVYLSKPGDDTEKKK